MLIQKMGVQKMQHEYNVLKFIKADVCTTVLPIRTNVLRGGGYCLDDNLLQNAVSLQSLRNQDTSSLFPFQNISKRKKLHRDIVRDQAEQGCRSSRCVRGVFACNFLGGRDKRKGGKRCKKEKEEHRYGQCYSHLCV